MNPEQAKDRAKALLNVIETMYEIRITNLEEVIEAIIEKTLDEQKILTICTSLNSWVAMNVLGGEVEIPMAVVNGLTGKIMRL
jgi:mannose/fructose/N-acetylgalactosamine-specific phosphotransferase system component IIB